MVPNRDPRIGGAFDLDKPLYTISVASEILETHPRTLMMYEDLGLIEPYRTATNRRRYSQRNVSKLQVIQQLTREKGVNLAGVMWGSQFAAGHMAKQRKGSIINTASIAGIDASYAISAYRASKAGVIGFARSLAREIASRNVTVNVVSPGFVTTDMTAAISEARAAQILEQVPLQRMASPEAVA